ncbi:MAG: histidyl-tRNA synthetase, partial [Planctomycetota bacterium]
GLDYYTRTVFEIHAPDLGARSALCGGGRYDHLVRDLGGPDVPAVGFAIGFTGTLIVFEQLGLLEGLERDTADVYVIGFSAEQKTAVLQVANDLRKGGISAIYDVDERSFKAQMKAAGKGGHKYAVILGEDELARGVVQLKDLEAKSQEEVARDELVEAILNR